MCMDWIGLLQVSHSLIYCTARNCLTLQIHMYWQQVFYYILTQHQYIIINTLIFGYMFWYFINHLQASVYHIEVHSVCTYIMGSHSV